MGRSTPSRSTQTRLRRLLLYAWSLSLTILLLAGLLFVPDGGTYWRCIARHAGRRVTLRDTRFPWRQRVEQSVARWQREVFPRIADPRERAAALQAAAEVLSRPNLAAEGADPIFTLLDAGALRPVLAGRDVRRYTRDWLEQARRLAPDDPIVLWQLTGRSANFSKADERELLEKAGRLDPDNSFWFYLLATIPADGELFSGRVARQHGAANRNAVVTPDQFSTNRAAMRDAFRQAGIGSILGMDSVRLPSSWTDFALRDPVAFARDAQRARRCATYRHPQRELNRRIEEAARRLGLPRWSRARLQRDLTGEFPAGREFSVRFSNRAYQPTSLYRDAELLALGDALAAGDGQAARASYRRLLGLFRHLWQTYRSAEQRGVAVVEFLVPCLALLKDPEVQRMGCFPAEFAEQVRLEYGPFLGASRGKGTFVAAGLTSTFAPASPGPPPVVRGWLIFCDGLARAGLALAIAAGLLYVIARRLESRLRSVTATSPGASISAARWIAWVAPCVLLLLLTGVEGALALAGKYAATATPSHGAEQFLYIAWSLVCCTAAAVAATLRRDRHLAARRNVGVLVFVAVLLGCYFATRLFGFPMPTGDVMIPWSNLAHVLLDPTRGRSFYELLDFREIALVLAPVALAATVVAAHALLQIWRGRRKAARDHREHVAAADEGMKDQVQGLALDIHRIRAAAGLQRGAFSESGDPRRSTGPEGATPSDGATRTPAGWSRRAVLAGCVSLVLWSAISAVTASGLWMRLPAVETEEATLRTLRDFTGAPPQRGIDVPAMLGRAPVDVSLRLRSAWGFWQFVAGSVVLSVALFTVSTRPESAARLPWTTRFSLWPPQRTAALRRCVTATLGWLAVLGATVHMLGFVGAGFWIHVLS